MKLMVDSIGQTFQTTADEPPLCNFERDDAAAPRSQCHRYSPVRRSWRASMRLIKAGLWFAAGFDGSSSLAIISG
jgi:hypothetical protein